MAGRRAPEALTDHVVICNVNEKVPAIVDELWNDPVGESIDVAIIVQDRALWESHPSWHPRDDGSRRVVEVFGCPAEGDVLREARITRARAAIILADPLQGTLADARSALVGIAIENENREVHTVMELLLSVNRSHLRATTVDEVICLGEVSEKLLSQSSVTPGVSHLFAHLLTTRNGTAQIFVRSVPNVLVGSSYRELARRAIRNRAPYVVCGFIRHRARFEAGASHESIVVLNPRVDTDPGKDSLLDTRDKLIVLASSAPDLDLILG
jgi:Calcium-activated potassium channel slowpoke-like RCK domain